MTGRIPPPLSEAAFQSRVVDWARLNGLLVFHDHDSRRNQAGFPDLVLVGRRVLYVELKSETGRLRPEQHIWLDAIRTAEGDAAVAIWRPSDWPAAEAAIRDLRVNR